jgi:hypothetical protein
MGNNPNPESFLIFLLKQSLPFLLGFFTAIFAEPIRQLIFKPKLKLDFGDNPDCLSLTPEGDKFTPINKMRKTYYIRIKVTNLKKVEAKNCKAYLINIEKADKEGKFAPTIYCDSIPIAWSCQNLGEQYDGININNGVSQFADVLVTREGHSQYFYPQIKLEPFRYKPIFEEKGKFRFSIQVTASNTDPEIIKLVFEWNGIWDKFKIYRDIN